MDDDMEHRADSERPNARAFAAHLSDVTFPATRADLADAAAVARAPSWVLDLIANLDRSAPFESLSQAWAEAAGSDGS